jgi:hypothetical protein
LKYKLKTCFKKNIKILFFLKNKKLEKKRKKEERGQALLAQPSLAHLEWVHVPFLNCLKERRAEALLFFEIGLVFIGSINSG